MDRREALKLGLGVTAGMTLSTATGCAPGAREVSQGHTPENMEAYLANLDQQLRKIRDGRFVEGFAGQATGKAITPELRGKIAPLETQFQSIMGTLLLTQSFRDMPEAQQFHPGMQKRMSENMESMDASVFQVNEMLANLDAGQRESTRETLRKHPGLAMRLAESLDEQAALAGISGSRRVQLRSMLTQTSFRLANNDPSVVIDEYVRKVRRAAEPSAAEIAASRTAGYAGSEAFWRYRDQLADANPGHTGSSDPGNDSDSKPVPKGVMVGLKMMGIGVVTFGISAIFVSAGTFPFVFGMTIGAVLFAIGLITMIISAIIAASNS